MTPRSRRPLPGAATVLSLVLYASLCALMLLTVCAGLGWLERPAPVFADLPLPGYMRKSSLGFYDKSELRQTLSAMLLLSAGLALLFSWLAARRKPVPRLHPAHAAFAVVLYFSSFTLPPYELDLDHWFPLVAAATGIRNGVWPYFSGYDSGYGLLAPAVLALWLKWFGLSELSLSALVSASTLAAGGASFALMRRLTGSRGVALLGTAWLLLEAAGATAVVSTFRAPVQISLGALLLYASLRNNALSAPAGFLFGLVALWNPTFGAFAVAGFACAHAYCIGRAPVPARLATARPLAAMLTGLLLPLLAVWAVFTDGELSGAAGALGSSGSLFVLGYGNLAQQFDLLIVPAFFMAILYAALLYRRRASGRALTRRQLFVGATLVGAIPWVLYATGRSDSTHYFAAWWALLPCIALYAWGFVRLLALRPAPRTARMSLTVLCVVFVVLFPFYRISELLAKYFTGYEGAREAWYTACAAGAGCDPRKKPTLSNHLRSAAEPLARGRLAQDPGLLAACRQRHAILSYNDAWIYATGDCYAPTGVPTVNLINTRAELERYVAVLAAQPQVLIDPGSSIYAQWKGDMLGEIKAQLLRRGFAETRGCGRFSVLSRGTPDSAPKALCA